MDIIKMNVDEKRSSVIRRGEQMITNAFLVSDSKEEAISILVEAMDKLIADIEKMKSTMQ